MKVWQKGNLFLKSTNKVDFIYFCNLSFEEKLKQLEIMTKASVEARCLFINAKNSEELEKTTSPYYYKEKIIDLNINIKKKFEISDITLQNLAQIKHTKISLSFYSYASSELDYENVWLNYCKIISSLNNNSVNAHIKYDFKSNWTLNFENTIVKMTAPNNQNMFIKWDNFECIFQIWEFNTLIIILKIH